MRVNSCSRSSHLNPKNAPRYTILLTTLSSPMALSQDTCLSPRGIPPQISVTSRVLSHKRTSLDCGRCVSLMVRSRQLRPGIVSHLRRAQVVPPAASHSKSASSRRRCNPAVLSLHCSALRANLLWWRLLAVLLFAESRRCSENCRPQRRRLLSRPVRPTRLGTNCKGSLRRVGQVMNSKGGRKRCG